MIPFYGSGLLAWNVIFNTQIIIKFVCLCFLEINRQFHPQSLLESAHKINLLPLLRQINNYTFSFLILSLNKRRPIDFLSNLIDKLVGKLHHPFVVLIGAIELTASEFGVMGLVDAFITEVFANLEYF